MKRAPKKLTLQRETLSRLRPGDVAGGLPTGRPYSCPECANTFPISICDFEC